jgi:hypothetical protein
MAKPFIPLNPLNLPRLFNFLHTTHPIIRRNLSDLTSHLPPPHQTLTTASPPAPKVRIGISATLGGILLLALRAFTFFHYGKHDATISNTNEVAWEKAELGTEMSRADDLGPGLHPQGKGEDGFRGSVGELAGRER